MQQKHELIFPSFLTICNVSKQSTVTGEDRFTTRRFNEILWQNSGLNLNIYNNVKSR